MDFDAVALFKLTFNRIIIENTSDSEAKNINILSFPFV
jgi:hypothetical protein